LPVLKVRYNHGVSEPVSATSVTLARFKRLPQRTGEVWQGGIVRFPIWAEDPADPHGPPLRPSGAIWVSLRTGLVHAALAKEGAEATPELALETLLQFGLKRAKELEGRPARIEVRDSGLCDALAEPLAALDTTIVVVEDQPAVRDALRTFEEEDEDGEPMPGLLEAEGMSVERIRAFAEAAALFYAAQPWDRLANEDLIAVESEQMPREMRFVGVLGQASELCGLSFFDSRRAFDRVFERADAGDIPTRSNGVIFDWIDSLPFVDVDLWQDHSLPVAAPNAYPLAADFAVDGSVRRPSARELSFGEGLLRALATATEDELDAGNWQTRVETFDGPLDLRLSLPLLLEAEAGRPRRHVPRTVTALERAQDLAHEAMDATGRLRIKLARRALAISEDCADAWIVLADAASTAQAAVVLYEGGMRAGAAAIGAERFESLRGAFSKDPETQPYMQARLGLAEALTDQGRHADAVGHYRALLELDPDDSLGVRYLLLSQLLREGANDEAGRLLAEYEDDTQAMWLHGRLLWRYRGDGDTESTREAFAAAVGANPHVVKYLLDPDAMPDPDAPAFELGSREEAAYVADALVDAFESTAGALEWLAAQTTRRRRPKARPSRRVH
jgi:tetratricopeptide (TPR) repeat protein